jgi:hypothetical protein
MVNVRSVIIDWEDSLNFVKWLVINVVFIKMGLDSCDKRREESRKEELKFSYYQGDCVI